MRRIRPTFLLRCAVLAGSVGIFFLVLKLSTSGTFTGTTILVLIAFWFLGIEGGLLPFLLEHILVRKAERSGGADSLWFVDVNRERKREFDAHADATSDNPTIR